MYCRCFCLLVVILLISSIVSGGTYSGGSGSLSSPYEIANLDDWMELIANPEDWDVHFIQTANLDLKNQGYHQAPLAPDTDAEISGHQGTTFTGSYNGQGFIIDNLTIIAPDGDYIGLIGNLNGINVSRGQVLNIKLTNVQIEGRDYTGALAGLIRNWSGNAQNCSVSGSVSGHNCVGALVGYFDNSTSASQISSLGTIVSGNDYVGGLVGRNNGQITEAFATGGVTGNHRVGGLSGTNTASMIDCYAMGNVTGSGDNVAGLIGENGGQLTSCYASGNINGVNRVAGLVGTNIGTIQLCYASGAATGSQNHVGGLVGYNIGPITNCYALGAVNARERAGGLVGANGNLIENSYSIGDVVANLYPGGLAGENAGGTASNCFWDVQTSHQNNSTGGTGLSTEQMQDMQTYLDAGWDFTGEEQNGTDDLWLMSPCIGYPVLAWQPPCNPPSFAGGTGSCEDPYLIETAEHLNNVRVYPEACFKQIADIDLATASWLDESGWLPIGDNDLPFTGSYDGAGYMLAFLTIDRPEQDEVGLFGCVRAARLMHIELANADIKGKYYAGALAGSIDDSEVIDCVSSGKVAAIECVSGLIGGSSQSTIKNCGSHCAVSGEEPVGGLLGRLEDASFIIDSYATGSVTGEGNLVGGLIGVVCDGSQILNCGARGNVSGVNMVGGLLGNIRSGSTLESCYAIGTVSGSDFVGGLIGEVMDSHVVWSLAKGEVTGISSVGGLTGAVLGNTDGLSSSISDSYAHGSVQGTSAVGGFAGQMIGVDGGLACINQSYAVGNVVADSNAGGLVGQKIEFNNGQVQIVSSFWDTQTSGLTHSAGGIGLDTAAMQQAETFISAGWDYIKTWGIGEGQTYPYLQKKSRSDLNDDGNIDLADLAILSSDWLLGHQN